ncbi:hypothetical protein FA95DRAFT_1045426 [Auriscalpium vulgare]|uniref:Uncharacterized protein n=1 Tax=Auriscalpium vulgare TaxID=40419 RepID=A0ACB8SAL0_9AGAM|nr:hypothetical protein FA95DRAFT_1045426 [Auriscalpium vulgare]
MRANGARTLLFTRPRSPSGDPARVNEDFNRRLRVRRSPVFNGAPTADTLPPLPTISQSFTLVYLRTLDRARCISLSCHSLECRAAFLIEDRGGRFLRVSMEPHQAQEIDILARDTMQKTAAVSASAGIEGEERRAWARQRAGNCSDEARRDDLCPGAERLVVREWHTA